MKYFYYQNDFRFHSFKSLIDWIQFLSSFFYSGLRLPTINKNTIKVRRIHNASINDTISKIKKKRLMLKNNYTINRYRRRDMASKPKTRERVLSEDRQKTFYNRYEDKYEMLTKILYNGISKRAEARVNEAKGLRHEGFKSPVKLIQKLFSKQRINILDESEQVGQTLSSTKENTIISPLSKENIVDIRAFKAPQTRTRVFSGQRNRCFSSDII